MGGYGASKKLSIRVEFYEKYLKFISFLSTEIRYSANSLPELFERYDNRSMVSCILKSCLTEMEKGNNITFSWRTGAESIKERYGLKIEDIEFIKGFGDDLGSSDIEGQISHCKLNMELANTYLKSAREEKERKSKLFLMLGLFLGVAIALVLG